MLPAGVRCTGIADAGEAVGNGWSKWMIWELDWFDWCGWLLVELWFWVPPMPLGASDCIVVRVVVSERTDGAGDEKVLSPPRRDSKPPFAVRLVPARDDAPCDTAVMDREVYVSWSVETVGAIDRPPVVGGGRPSVDSRGDSLLPREVTLDDLALRPVETV